MPNDKSFLENVAMESKKPESFNEENFESINPNIKRKKYIRNGIVLFLFITVIFVVAYSLSQVTVPQMVGWNVNEAYEWAQKNNVNLVIKDTYNFDIDQDIVLSQDVEADKKIKKKSVMTVTVSLGPNGDELIDFPEIKTMSSSEIESWINDHKLSGAKIETEYSDLVEKDSVIRYEMLDGTEENFKRKSRVTIYVSDGSEELSETVVVPDFTNGQVATVITWGSENSVTISIKEVFDEYLNSGLVVYQSVSKETEMLRDDVLTVKVSKGKPIIVPNFSSIGKTQAEEWAKSNNISLTLKESYSNSKAAGKLISQSIKSGSSITNEDSIVITYSIGKVDVTSFISKTKLDVLQWRDTVNEKNGNIKITFNEEYGEAGTFGKVIEQSIYDEIVNTGTTIQVVISKGMKLVIPDFTGKTEKEANDMAKEMGLKCLFDYQYSDNVEKDYVISQSISANTIITDNEKVKVVISLGKDN